jgi:hypothetical protein
MNRALKNLSRCGDIGSLESALRTLCTEFGSVSRLDVLPMVGAGKRQAVCLLRLDSSERERDLMTTLGASRFGENVYVVVDLRRPD